MLEPMLLGLGEPRLWFAIAKERWLDPTVLVALEAIAGVIVVGLAVFAGIPIDGVVGVEVDLFPWVFSGVVLDLI